MQVDYSDTSSVSWHCHFNQKGVYFHLTRGSLTRLLWRAAAPAADPAFLQVSLVGVRRPRPRRSGLCRYLISVLMHGLSYPTATEWNVLSNKITKARIVISFKDSPRRPLGRRGDLSSRAAPSSSSQTWSRSSPRSGSEQSGGGGAGGRSPEADFKFELI